MLGVGAGVGITSAAPLRMRFFDPFLAKATGSYDRPGQTSGGPGQEGQVRVPGRLDSGGDIVNDVLGRCPGPAEAHTQHHYGAPPFNMTQSVW